MLITQHFCHEAVAFLAEQHADEASCHNKKMWVRTAYPVQGRRVTRMTLRRSNRQNVLVPTVLHYQKVDFFNT